MTRNAILTVYDDGLPTFYERVLNYLHETYHVHPTSLTVDADPEENARQSSYAALARDTSRWNCSQDHLPDGKRVY